MARRGTRQLGLKSVSEQEETRGEPISVLGLFGNVFYNCAIIILSSPQ